MHNVLVSMMENIIIYVWRNEEKEDDNGALLIASTDIDRAKEFSEYNADCMATSFTDFKNLLGRAGIDYYDISNNFDVFEFG